MVPAGEVPGQEADEQAEREDGDAEADGDGYPPALQGFVLDGRRLVFGGGRRRRLLGRLWFGRLFLGRLWFGLHPGKGRGVVHHMTTGFLSHRSGQPLDSRHG